MKSIADLRKSYELGELNEDAASADPLILFTSWLDQALANKLPEPNAMTLATVDAQCRPSTRIVLLKSYDADGLVWFTNYDSRKGRQLAGNPAAALQFHWVEMERVVRIEGMVHKVSEAESDEYFKSRPLASRIGAWASDQSSVLSSRGALLARAAEVGLRYGLNPPRPPHWGGYRLVPDRWEFWQGRPSRLHDRLAYRRSGPQEEAGAGTGGWIRDRLSP
jgi:pyridoxamine 5'-phosphate oxidase